MKNTHSFNFLLELIIVIICFTFSSIVFVGLFYKSYQMNLKASIKARANMSIQTLAEEYKMNGEIISDSDYSDYFIEVTIDDNKCHLSAIFDDSVIEEIDVMYLGGLYE